MFVLTTSTIRDHERLNAKHYSIYYKPLKHIKQGLDNPLNNIHGLATNMPQNATSILPYLLNLPL